MPAGKAPDLRVSQESMTAPDAIDRLVARVSELEAASLPSRDGERDRVEVPARAMALASDDGCFDDLDTLDATRDLMSQEGYDEEAGSGDEDREHYRKLARAALAAASPSGETGGRDEDEDERASWVYEYARKLDPSVETNADADALIQCTLTKLIAARERDTVVSPSAETAGVIPREFWRGVPCGHPPDPVAMYGRDGDPICHCGWYLGEEDGREVEGAPGPVVLCQKCGCHVAIPPVRWGDRRRELREWTLAVVDRSAEPGIALPVTEVDDGRWTRRSRVREIPSEGGGAK
jgi:hypothetical protein